MINPKTKKSGARLLGFGDFTFDLHFISLNQDVQKIPTRKSDRELPTLQRCA